MDRDINDAVGPEEEADVSCKLSVSPVGAIGPRHFDFRDCLVNELDRFLGEVEGDTTPIERGDGEVFDTVLLDVAFLIECHFRCAAAFDEDLGVMDDVFAGPNEDDVVDVGVDFAASTFEVEQEECRSLSNIATVTLAHAETILLIKFVSLLETEELADSWVVSKLIVVGREIEGCCMGALMNQIDDIRLSREFNTE